MKRCFLAFSAVLFVILCGCGGSLLDSRYVIIFPELPQAWDEVLGSPHWQLEWIDADGKKGTLVLQGKKNTEISLLQTGASPVFALPYWPEKGLSPGVFKPAGAIFPFDVSSKNLKLSWQGGVDAFLYRELATAWSGQENNMPQYFNWPRFRRLLDDPGVNAEFRRDPWLADWRTIAEKIIASGFDKRRLVPEARSSLKIPVHSGPWVGTSPFADPLLFESMPVFPVRAAADTWVSANGILRCNTDTWILMK